MTWIHGETDEGGAGSRIPLEVALEAAIMADPGQSSFDDPRLGKTMNRRCSLRFTISSFRVPVFTMAVTAFIP
jgi:hypothetical protein